MNKKRSLTAVAVGAVAALTLTACGQQANTQEGAITAVFSNIAETPTLDPAVTYSSDGFLFVRHISDSIIVMRHGDVVERGETSQVCENPRSDYAKELIGSWLEPVVR